MTLLKTNKRFKKNMKIQTKMYLPLFPGFFGTIFSPEYVIDHEMYINDEKLESLDFKEFETRVATECCKAIEDEINSIFFKYDDAIKINFLEVYSPRFYNFQNDCIITGINLSTDTLKAILMYVNASINDFENYILERYTSRDGFLSYYSNDARTWVNDLRNVYTKCITGTSLQDCDFDEGLSSVINFILINEGFCVDELLYRVIEEYNYINELSE